MQEFADDDDGYARCFRDNPTGFFLNVRHNPGPINTAMQRAACRTIAPIKK